VTARRREDRRQASLILAPGRGHAGDPASVRRRPWPDAARVGRYFIRQRRSATRHNREEKVRDCAWPVRPAGFELTRANQNRPGTERGQRDAGRRASRAIAGSRLSSCTSRPRSGPYSRRPPGSGRAGRLGSTRQEGKMLRHWKSWLTIFIMSEGQHNEGVLGPRRQPVKRCGSRSKMLGRGQHCPNQADAEDLRGWDEADAERRGNPGAGWAGARAALGQTTSSAHTPCIRCSSCRLETIPPVRRLDDTP